MLADPPAPASVAPTRSVTTPDCSALRCTVNTTAVHRPQALSSTARADEAALAGTGRADRLVRWRSGCPSGTRRRCPGRAPEVWRHLHEQQRGDLRRLQASRDWLRQDNPAPPLSATRPWWPAR